MTHFETSGDLSHRADQQRRGNRDRVPLASGVVKTEFVVEAILAADKRRAERDGDVVARQGRTHQATEGFRPLAIAPAEVVENRDATRVGADSHAIPYRFVDRARCHMVRIEIAVTRIHSAGDRNSTARAEHGPQYRGVARAIVRDADKRLHNAATLHLVIVLANDRFFTGDVGRREVSSTGRPLYSLLRRLEEFDFDADLDWI